MVTRPTHASGILDIILSNLQPKYSVPTIRPPATPNLEGHGKPSDHSYALARPQNQCDSDTKTREYKKVTFRPTPDSDRQTFAKMILSVSWNLVTNSESVCEKVKNLDKMVGDMVDIAFPTVTVRTNSQDLPFITDQLKKLARRKKQEYKRHGRTQKYRKLNEEYKAMFKIEANRYVEKNVREIQNSQPGRAARILKQLGAAPGDQQTKDFTLTNHVEKD